MLGVPAISVIIPLYNKGPYIGRAIESVLNQTFLNFEVIVVDDGSTDNGAIIVREFRDRRIRLIQQKNQGASAARNNGVEAASADLVAFLDADDEWLPNFLETTMRLRKNYPEARAYGTAYYTCDYKNKLTEPKYVAIPDAPWEGILPNYFLSVALGPYLFNSSTFCIDIRAYRNLGGYLVGEAFSEDTEFWGRVALRFPIAFSREFGAIYHTEAQNRACAKVGVIKREPIVITAELAIDKQEVNEKIIADLSEYINSLELKRAQTNIMAGDLSEAQQILMNCDTHLFIGKKTALLIMTLIPHTLFRFLWRVSRHIRQNLGIIDYSGDHWFKQ